MLAWSWQIYRPGSKNSQNFPKKAALFFLIYFYHKKTKIVGNAAPDMAEVFQPKLSKKTQQTRMSDGQHGSF